MKANLKKKLAVTALAGLVIVGAANFDSQKAVEAKKSVVSSCTKQSKASVCKEAEQQYRSALRFNGI